jgi:ubiquinone/menaquinone biosynthesis C-methylase UbiE
MSSRQRKIIWKDIDNTITMLRINKKSIRLFLEYNIELVMLILRRNDSSNFQVKRVYESNDFVDDYLPQIELQIPEMSILEELRSGLPYWRMLDIGVGTGRTTKHFAGLVKEYIGVDYSSALVKACREKFPKYRIEWADARKLSLFDDSFFDFVLFSFNGIDAVEHKDRLAILLEIRRVLRKGGYFCFSTLNLNSWQLKPIFRFSKNPTTLYRSTYNFLLNHKVWPNIKQTRRKKQHMMAYFRYKDFLVRDYFSTPIEQLKQLRDAGFSDIKAYGLNSGKIVSDPTNMLDYYVYFLAKAK